MKSLAIWLIGYSVLAAAVIAWLVSSRPRLLEVLSDPAVKADWQAYQKELGTEAEKNASVRHKVATNPDPPLLVMFRDRFPAIVIASLVSLGMFYGMAVFIVCGLCSKKPLMTPQTPANPPEIAP